MIYQMQLIQCMSDQWITAELPDADLTVLMRLQDLEYPIWVGFHDGDGWRSADSTSVDGPVLGWMQLEDAAAALDTLTRERLPSNNKPNTTMR